MDEVPSSKEQTFSKQKSLAMRRRIFVRKRLRYTMSLQNVFLRVEGWLDKKLSLKYRHFFDAMSVRNKFITPKRNR